MWNSWEDLCISENATLSDAINKMNSTGVQCVLIVGADKNLVGLTTDGDIRRGIILSKDLDGSIWPFINKNCFTLSGSFTQSSADKYFEKSKNILIPIIKNNKLINVIFNWKRVNFPGTHSTCALIMAGGFGTRLRPLTKNCPKPMITLDNRPILQIQIEQLKKSGINDFFISTHYHPEVIHNYFGDGSKFDISITYIHEETPKGTAGALSLLPKSYKNFDNMIMMNGDILTNIQFNRILAYHEDVQVNLTVCIKKVENQVQFGVIEVNDQNEIINIVEKPIQENLVSSGIYIIETELIEKLNFKEKLDFPQVIEQCLSNGEPINTYLISEYWTDIGTIADLQRARKDVYLQF